MSGQEDIEGLIADALADSWLELDCAEVAGVLTLTVEAIVARHVEAALTEAAEDAARRVEAQIRQLQAVPAHVVDVPREAMAADLQLLADDFRRSSP